MKDYEKEFPLQATKVEGVTKKFNLADPVERREYFEAKVGKEIEKLQVYFQENTFVAYLLGKKNSGKGTYTKLLMEVFGEDKLGHISIGDIVRVASVDMKDEGKKKEIMDYLEKNYRGYISIDDAIRALTSRDTKSLLPTEFILTLVKREIDKMDKKTLFVDGFPRDLDQVSYSLYFRDLIDYRDDLDIFVAISVPEAVIDERMRTRVVCPKCKTPRNPKLLPTNVLGYDKEKNEIYLVCDDAKCGGARMVGKEGDNLGIESVRERLELDDKLIEKVFSLHGVPRILLRNAVPVDFAKENFDDYETTPEFVHEYDEASGEVKTSEKPWIFKDDDGNDAYSLMAPVVVVSWIRQLVKVLGL